MRADELIYCKQSEKKILIVSPSPKQKAELEDIFSQIDMPSLIIHTSDVSSMPERLREQAIHAILIDTALPAWNKLIHTIRANAEKLPIIVLHGDEPPVQTYRIPKGFVKKFIHRESLRFCGQILYRIINQFALNRHYQLEMNTHKKLRENISGLRNLQAFWNDSANIQDETTRHVLQEVEQTLEYLEKLKSELNLKPISD